MKRHRHPEPKRPMPAWRRAVRARRLRQGQRSPEELRALALAIHRNEVFTDRHCRSRQEIQNSFAVLMFMDRPARRALGERMGKSGMVFEFMREAAPRGINGLPMFFSLKVLDSVEARVVDGIVGRLRAAEASVLSS